MSQPALPLLLIRSKPDMAALARWAARSGQRALRDDRGYALHAASLATMGVLAPKPFALIERQQTTEFIGYRRAQRDDVLQALELGRLAEPEAAQALGLNEPERTQVVAMPNGWRQGQRLSFDVRIAPVVRSRTKDGHYPEVDAAFHPAFGESLALADEGTTEGEGQEDGREAAHGRWLARELGRNGAASLLTWRPRAFQLTSIARRLRPEADGERRTRPGLLPDLTVTGVLAIDDPPAFDRLIERGLGRHRSFGFGCLLLAPEGARS